MPSRAKITRPSLLPSGDFDRKLIPATRQPLRNWYRVHKTSLPVLRFGVFPWHRFSHRRCPYGLLYVGSTIQTCLWEVFGDDLFRNRRTIAKAKWATRSISQISVPELNVCAVTLESTRAAMEVDKGNLMAADLAIPQAWGLAVQRHPAGFEAVYYASRFIDQPCLALFDRGCLRAKLKAGPLGGLSDNDAAVNWLHEHQVALV